MKRYGMPAQLKNGLVLHLPGVVSGTTAYDLSGQGNNGTLVNSPGSQRRQGYKGFTFNGTNQSISFTNTASLRPTAFTFACVMNNPSNTNSHVFFQSYSQNTNIAGFSIGIKTLGGGGTSNRIELLVGKNTGVTQGTDYGYWTSADNVNDAKNKVLVVSYNGSGTAKIYLDGVSRTFTASGAFAAAPAWAATSYVRMGAEETPTISKFDDGTKYNAALWNRVLSDSEVQLVHKSFFIP